ncbi:putative fluoride ion transporter CrcB [Sphaerisporangium rufum]|uniref:Fluoride-specific ion channel FluC n=1 Tax=Sphaerisporangium rufum TaxID=1381558 RepID=A0A919R8K2_9ACTN|nr:CrcB family protein [Sphaerisporangium rufum]GII81647.1 putative fluoride ion transporter CrcB [Sphaerisporangium rufum]
MIAGTRRATLAAISAGGVLGSLSRYGLGVAFPTSPGGFPWTTFAINLLGCLLIGALMAAIGMAGHVSPLLRPFAGVGLLGGFTTFSGYVVDIGRVAGAGRPATAAAYLAATVLLAVPATFAGAAGTRALIGVLRERRSS